MSLKHIHWPYRIALIGGASYLSDLLIAHAATHILLIREDEKARTHEPLFSDQHVWTDHYRDGLTSSNSNDASSSLQSLMRSRSVASTTQIKASVFSK